MTGNISLMKTICFWSQEKGRRVAIFILFVCFSNEPAEGLFLQRRFHQLYSPLCLPLFGDWCLSFTYSRCPRTSGQHCDLCLGSDIIIIRDTQQDPTACSVPASNPTAGLPELSQTVWDSLGNGRKNFEEVEVFHIPLRCLWRVARGEWLFVWIGSYSKDTFEVWEFRTHILYLTYLC